MQQFFLAIFFVLLAKVVGFEVEYHFHLVSTFVIPTFMGVTVTPLMVALALSMIVTIVLLVKLPMLAVALIATSVTEFLAFSPYVGLSFDDSQMAAWYIMVPLSIITGLFVLDERDHWYVNQFWRTTSKIALPTGLVAINVIEWNVYQDGQTSIWVPIAVCFVGILIPAIVSMTGSEKFEKSKKILDAHTAHDVLVASNKILADEFAALKQQIAEYRALEAEKKKLEEELAILRKRVKTPVPTISVERQTPIAPAPEHPRVHIERLRQESLVAT